MGGFKPPKWEDVPRLRVEPRAFHPTGECLCPVFTPSGRFYGKWEACRICGHLPRQRRR